MPGFKDRIGGGPWMSRERVVVAMSGGVDSSVAAALLVEQGHDVIGVTLNVWPERKGAEPADRVDACCSLAAVEDARRVADHLAIPHYTLNFRDIFAGTVIANFCSEYVRGRTPNPCIRCNAHIKFGALLAKARGLGARYIATGHHARTRYDSRRGRHILQKGVDRDKDQSYVLYVMTQDQLAHTLMPVGHITKSEVRQMAAERGLPVARKPESQEICFVPEGDYGAFLQDYVPNAARPGPILDKSGNLLGHHKGIAFYTVGQRRGLGLAGREPHYVIAIDPSRNALIVGSERDLYSSDLEADDLNFISIPELKQPMKVAAKIRYRSQEAEAVASPLSGGKMAVHFHRPQRAITPGQAVVLYEGDVVVGGGTITTSHLFTAQ